MATRTKTERNLLHCPPLEELCNVLESGLNKNFADVQVAVADCPDLTREPFQFPVKGLCGSPRITDVGGVPYLVPLPQKHKEYDMNTVSREVELPGAFILGAAAAPSRVVGMNAELMPLVHTETEGRPAVNGSYFSSVNPTDGRCLQEKYSDTEFSACPLNTDDEVNDWLKHYEGLDLRVEHTHCFSDHGEGGHYYIDTTPDTVEYLGYFLPAEYVYRIDRPQESHSIGRD
ncbi:hypothetical protein CRUP_012566 [Coryphaenoides rupestris]|nr:hypothetical protein CRUP_012566 [Coryphaenoides rupestris]